MKQIKCKRCSTQIIFITTEKGRQMPCDPELIKINGQNEIVIALESQAHFTPSGEKFYKTVGKISRGIIGVEGYRPHWATCSDVR